MDTDKATPELFAALAMAQGELENADKKSSNPHFKSKYADLAEVLNTIRPVLAKHCLSLIQSTSFDGAMVSVNTLLAHKSGGYITTIASCVPAKSDAQGIGSATTYLRRYSAAAIAGIAQEDDDGNAAKHEAKPAPIGRPTDGVWESLDAETQAGLQKAAIVIGEFASESDFVGAVEFIDRQKYDTDEKAGLWTLLPSATRTALKKVYESRKLAA